MKEYERECMAWHSIEWRFSMLVSKGYKTDEHDTMTESNVSNRT
jgi:hypothetical protein